MYSRGRGRGRRGRGGRKIGGKPPKRSKFPFYFGTELPNAPISLSSDPISLLETPEVQRHTPISIPPRGRGRGRGRGSFLSSASPSPERLMSVPPIKKSKWMNSEIPLEDRNRPTKDYFRKKEETRGEWWACCEKFTLELLDSRGEVCVSADFGLRSDSYSWRDFKVPGNFQIWKYHTHQQSDMTVANNFKAVRASPFKGTSAIMTEGCSFRKCKDISELETKLPEWKSIEGDLEKAAVSETFIKISQEKYEDVEFEVFRDMNSFEILLSGPSLRELWIDAEEADMVEYWVSYEDDPFMNDVFGETKALEVNHMFLGRVLKSWEENDFSHLAPRASCVHLSKPHYLNSSYFQEKAIQFLVNDCRPYFLTARMFHEDEILGNFYAMNGRKIKGCSWRIKVCEPKIPQES